MGVDESPHEQELGVLRLLSLTSNRIHAAGTRLSGPSAATGQVLEHALDKERDSYPSLPLATDLTVLVVK